jgi:hypothetical protein
MPENPLTSEQAAFRWLLRVIVAAAVLIAVVLIIRAL